ERLTRASGAAIELAEGDEIVYTAASGSGASFVGMRLRIDGSLSGHCLTHGRTAVCHDTETDSRVDRAAARRVGARSVVLVPLRHDDRLVGVLKVVSDRPDAFEPGDVEVLELLADLMGSAIARAELLARLDEAAHVDALTGLPNRRAWDAQLER